MKYTKHTWVEWTEPFGPKNEPVYMRVTAETAIKVMRKLHKYEDNERALDDFVTVHFAKVYDIRED